VVGDGVDDTEGGVEDESEMQRTALRPNLNRRST
jgi:hypothetical protein